jgi:pimeloyl-ACP methyl ester carboxylesterase
VNKLVLGLVMLAGCGDESGVVVTMTVSGDAPAYGETPFPTDAVREGDKLGAIAGIDALIGKHDDLVVAHIAALDGFGLRPLVEFFVDGELAELPDEPGGLVDVDPASPDRGRTIAMEWRYDAERGVIQASPQSGQLLREGTRYAAYVTTAIRDANGAAIRPASALAELASHDRWRTTAEARDELARDDLAGIATFTTQHASAPLLAARVALDAAPPPVLTFPDPAIIFKTKVQLDRVLGTATRATEGPRAGLERWGNDNATGIAHDHVGVLGSGLVTHVRFRGDDTKTDLPDDETFQLENGVPRVIAIETIPITFILPAAAPPATGYPTVIYGHGLGASRDQMLSFAEPLTSRGYAIVGIDMSGHGSRFSPGDAGANMASQIPGFTGDPKLRDGFGDTTGLTTQFDFFEGFLAVAAVRDSIRQSALDLSRVVQLLKSNPNLDALGANAKLDTRRLAYMGESFGTVVGTVFAAIEPDVDLFVLDVPGGGILDLLLPTSPEIGALAMPIVETIYNPATPLGRWNPLIGLMQAVIDGADPLTYAPHVLRDRFTIGTRPVGPRSVVAIEVVGDQVLSNVGTDALVQGMGLDVLAPHLDLPAGLVAIESPAAGNRDGRTAVLVQYSPATHGANWSAERGTLRYLPPFPVEGDVPFPLLPSPITIENPIYETLEQVFEILATHQAGEAPRVRMTKPPTRDFDGDGALDDVDTSPYDPTVR